MKALTLQMIIHAAELVKAARGRKASIEFIKACYDKPDDIAAISHMLRKLDVTVNLYGLNPTKENSMFKITRS